MEKLAYSNTERDPIMIRNGRIVSDVYSGIGDLLISGGKIAACGMEIFLPLNRKVREIDATGCIVFPGAVDAHVHLGDNSFTGPTADTYESGSMAGIAGGTTSIIDFVTPTKGGSLLKAFEEKKEQIASSHADYGLHIHVTSWKNEYNKEIQECVDRGASSFKIYLHNKKTLGVEDKDLIKIVESVRKAGGLLMAHCENGELIEQLQKRYFAAKKRLARYHAASRPPFTEAESVFRMVSYAEALNIPTLISTVSTHDAVKIIKRAKERGVKVISETCPQYLTLDQSEYLQVQENAIGMICSPPLREKYHIDQLWKAISLGVIDVISSDHCSFLLKGQKDQGLHDFRKVPNGLMGIEERLGIIYTYGVKTGKLSLKKFVEMVSTQPAKIFGMYPQKGSFVTGADGDVVIWDPMATSSINTTSRYSKADYNVYAGYEISGKPSMVIQKGNVTYENGDFSSIIKGNYIFRNLPDLI